MDIIIELSNDDTQTLNDLAKRQNCTPTEVVLKALYQIYPQFTQPKKEYRKVPSGFDEGYSIRT